MKKQTKEQTTTVVTKTVKDVMDRVRVNFRVRIAMMGGSQAEATERVGYDPAVVSACVNSDNPTLKSLVLLATVAQTTVENLVKERNEND